MIGQKIFVGIEIEGPNKGEPTLYVGTLEVGYSIVDIALREKVSTVYFGAGDTRCLPAGPIGTIIELLDKHDVNIIIEVDHEHLPQLLTIDRNLLRQTYIVIAKPVDIPSDLVPFIKATKYLTTDDKVAWLENHESCYVNSINHPVYEQDKEVQV